MGRRLSTQPHCTVRIERLTVSRILQLSTPLGFVGSWNKKNPAIQKIYDTLKLEMRKQ